MDRLMNLDRRVIFLFIALAVILPLLRPLGLPVLPSKPVQKMYDVIEDLPDGSRVLLSFDYGSSTMPELYPMSLALLHHCFKRNFKVITMALWPEGATFAEQALKEVAEEYGKTYGEDYVHLGFKSGGLVVISAMGENIPETFPQDYQGKMVKEIPVMNGVQNFQDIDLIFDLSAGDPGIPAWVMIAQGRHQKVLGGGCTAVSAPQYFAYLQSGQLVGLLGGMKGAAEYEVLVEKKGTATAGMDAQSMAHSLIILLILLANIAFFSQKMKKEKR
ncbi:hypothetical protein IIA15_05825 [candidate division TA06 bacterium]|nr:hypothetical protein [candidate division TA06 bacterium]